MAVELLPEPWVFAGFRRELRVSLESVGVRGETREALILSAHEAAANGIEHSSGGDVAVTDAPTETRSCSTFQVQCMASGGGDGGTGAGVAADGRPDPP